jgi:hypothetical protein
MKIETKFEVGQVVYFTDKDKLKVNEIHSIDIEITKDKATTFYCFRRYDDGVVRFDFATEANVYATKDEYSNTQKQSE